MALKIVVTSVTILSDKCHIRGAVARAAVAAELPARSCSEDRLAARRCRARKVWDKRECAPAGDPNRCGRSPSETDRVLAPLRPCETGQMVRRPMFCQHVPSPRPHHPWWREAWHCSGFPHPRERTYSLLISAWDTSPGDGHAPVHCPTVRKTIAVTSMLESVPCARIRAEGDPSR